MKTTKQEVLDFISKYETSHKSANYREKQIETDIKLAHLIEDMYTSLLYLEEVTDPIATTINDKIAFLESNIDLLLAHADDTDSSIGLILERLSTLETSTHTIIKETKIIYVDVDKKDDIKEPTNPTIIPSDAIVDEDTTTTETPVTKKITYPFEAKDENGDIIYKEGIEQVTNSDELAEWYREQIIDIKQKIKTKDLDGTYPKLHGESDEGRLNRVIGIKEELVEKYWDTKNRSNIYPITTEGGKAKDVKVVDEDSAREVFESHLRDYLKTHPVRPKSPKPTKPTKPTTQNSGFVVIATSNRQGQVSYCLCKRG